MSDETRSVPSTTTPDEAAMRRDAGLAKVRMVSTPLSGPEANQVYWAQRNCPDHVLTLLSRREADRREIEGLRATVEALVNLCVVPYRNGRTRWWLRIQGVYPKGDVMAPKPPGVWDCEGNHWCYDNREDAVAVLLEAALTASPPPAATGEPGKGGGE